jgi:hypothetical protein
MRSLSASGKMHEVILVVDLIVVRYLKVNSSCTFAPLLVLCSYKSVILFLTISHNYNLQLHLNGVDFEWLDQL